MPRFWLPLLMVLLLLAFLVLRGPDGPPRLAPTTALGGPAGGLNGVAAPAAAISAAPSPTLPLGQPAPMAAPAFAEAAPGSQPYIPILMYHYVRYVDAGADPLGWNLSVTPEQLAAQLDWLMYNSYDSVQMQTVSACLQSRGPCPARAVALTFDDGYGDAFSAVLPMLQQRGLTATFYIVSGFVGQPGYMGWDEIRLLQAAGMEIGAHTVSHPDLTTLGHDDAMAQIVQSGATISAQLGIPITSFCYPAGRFNADIAAMTRDAGYTSATTTVQDGPQSDPFSLPRLRIYGDMAQEGFQATIAAYLP